MDQILSLLNDLAIPFSRYSHPAVFSCEESDRLCPPMPGAHTKQLLMKAKGKSPHPEPLPRDSSANAISSSGREEIFVLAIVMHDKRVDTKTLAKDFGAQSFSFASPEKMFELLHVTPGSVTPLGLVFDTQKIINVVVDEDAWKFGQFLFHPLVNTATLSMDKPGFEKFLAHTGHVCTVRAIPQRQKAAVQ